MADYSSSRFPFGGQYLENAVDTSRYRLEPLISPEQLRSRYLFGIPLISFLPNPITKKFDVMTDDILKDYINLSANQIELETGLVIFPTQFQESKPWDESEYRAFGYFKMQNKPIASIDSFQVVSADGAVMFTVPVSWISPGELVHGQVNIIPLLVSLADGGGIVGPNSGAGGASAAFLSFLAQTGRHWIPQFWKCTYTAGFSNNGQLPSVVNDLIGCMTAIRVLGMLSPTNLHNSRSLGVDGLTQSIGGQGPAVWARRLDELNFQKETLIKKLKKMYGQKFVAGSL